VESALHRIVGFGEDAAGNLYIVDLGGEIFRVTGPSVPALPGALPLAGLALGLATAAVLRIRRGSSSAEGASSA